MRPETLSVCQAPAALSRGDTAGVSGPKVLRLVDHRIYTIRLRKMAEFLDVFDRLAMPIQLKHLGPPIGLYVSDVGPLNQVLHLWAYEDLADYDRRRKLRDADPDWPAYLAASEHLIVAQENRFIRRVDLPSLTTIAPRSPSMVP